MTQYSKGLFYFIRPRISTVKPDAMLILGRSGEDKTRNNADLLLQCLSIELQ
jgi:hypothetical protein